MENKPDFYLIPTECGTLQDLRACWYLARVKDGEVRDDYMHVKIDPPLFGQEYGLGGKYIDQLILATRHQGFSLFPLANLANVTQWPIHVYVFQIIDEDVIKKCIITEKEHKQEQLRLIEWGTIYLSEKQARIV